MNGFEVILPFLKPIEHLILDDAISEVMVNGPDRVFIEKQGFLQQVPGVSLGDRSLMVAVKNIARRLGDDISEAKPILDSRLPDGSRVAAVIPPCSLRSRNAHDPQVQHPPLRDGGSDSRRDSRPRSREPPRRLRPCTQERAHLWWNWHWKIDPTFNPRKIHSAGGAGACYRRHGRASIASAKSRPL